MLTDIALRHSEIKIAEMLNHCFCLGENCSKLVRVFNLIGILKVRKGIL